jgi:hypothetical protein
VTVEIYVEGGGDSKELHSRCREGFRKLIEKCRFQGRMPKIIACGGREKTFDMFQTAHSNREGYAILLVDSEDPVLGIDSTPNSSIGWDHLHNRDRWSRPIDANNNQAQMMTTCMESWIMADHDALKKFYGSRLRDSALFPIYDLERRLRHDVQECLIHATADCGNGRSYKKGEHSFKLLASLDPEVLSRHLPHFQRFRQTLDEKLAYPQQVRH